MLRYADSGDLVDCLLTKYRIRKDIHANGGVHGTVLHAASRGNLCEVAQTIVKHGDVNVRVPVFRSRTPGSGGIGLAPPSD